MKKILLLMTAFAALIFTGCSNDEGDSSFKYGMDNLYGTWECIAANIEGNWIDITKYPYTELGFSATFKPDGTYYGRGYFGTGSGTYTAFGDMIYTYVDGVEYYRYRVKSLANNIAEITMISPTDGSSLDIKMQKQ